VIQDISHGFLCLFLMLSNGEKRLQDEVEMHTFRESLHGHETRRLKFFHHIKWGVCECNFLLDVFCMMSKLWYFSVMYIGLYPLSLNVHLSVRKHNNILKWAIKGFMHQRKCLMHQKLIFIWKAAMCRHICSIGRHKEIYFLYRLTHPFFR
jgi:hypothetical protein